MCSAQHHSLVLLSIFSHKIARYYPYPQIYARCHLELASSNTAPA